MRRPVPRIVLVLTVAAAVLLAIAWTLRQQSPSHSVGDGAVLEIYALHASRGALSVGPYSRFGWNHPGPVYFYALAPAYALSHYREAALLASVLILNLLVAAALVSVVTRYGGWPHAAALVVWLAVYYLRPSAHDGWDFADLLSSSWNPHAPLLPFALLLTLSAALAAGHIGVLPFIVVVASFVSQTHVAFLPMSLLIAGSAFAAWLWSHQPPGWTERIPSGPVSNAVRVLDGIGAVYVALILWVILAGGFDIRLGSVDVSVNSIDKLLIAAIVFAGIRHLISRNHPLLHRVAARAGAGSATRVWSPAVRRVLLASAIVLLAMWSMPVVGEFTGAQPGNLVRMARSIGANQTPDPRVGAAVFAYELAAVVTPDVPVAAGGRVLGSDVATLRAGVVAAGQVIGLVFVLVMAKSRRRSFIAAQAYVCLVASAAALWAATRVGHELHDHLVFWISMLGVVNLATVSAGILCALPGEGTATASLRTSVAWAAVMAGGVGVLGASHILAGHHLQRFAAERQQVARLADPVLGSVAADGVPDRVRVEIAQDAWPIAAGLILELYKRGIEVSVADAWVTLCGPPMAPTDRETVELFVADPSMADVLHADTRYQRVATDGNVFVFRRPL